LHYLLIPLIALQVITAQSNTASISGSVIDGKTQKPIPSAVVVAIRSGVAALISGLLAGNYNLCAQPDDPKPKSFGLAVLGRLQ